MNSSTLARLLSVALLSGFALGCAPQGSSNLPPALVGAADGKNDNWSSESVLPVTGGQLIKLNDSPTLESDQAYRGRITQQTDDGDITVNGPMLYFQFYAKPGEGKFVVRDLSGTGCVGLTLEGCDPVDLLVYQLVDGQWKWVGNTDLPAFANDFGLAWDFPSQRFIVTGINLKTGKRPQPAAADLGIAQADGWMTFGFVPFRRNGADGSYDIAIGAGSQSY